MTLKEELGKKIKSIRIDKGFTQLDVCNDESELTIRQLVRIEKGESLPSLTKIKYISEQLDVDMRDLIDIDKIILPKKYLEIKNCVWQNKSAELCKGKMQSPALNFCA